MNGEDDAATPACAGDRGPAPEDDQSSLQEVRGPWEAVSSTGVTVALDTIAPETITPDTLADTDSPWAHGQTGQTGPSSPPTLPAPASVVIVSNAIRWAETPLEVELQPANEVTEDATDDVDIAPRQLQLTPD